MRKLIAPVAVLVSVLALAPAAFAKEPGQATINGAGLAGPIELAFRGDGDSEAERFFALLDQSGLWATYKPADRPEGDLGPRYVVTVTWGDPSRTIGENRFYIYPYATPQPVTYTPEQSSSPNSPGAIPGWYVTSSSFSELLTDLGLPKMAPAVADVPANAGRPLSGLDEPPWGWILGIGALGTMVLLGALAARRRSRILV